jgi:hypothetical protein
MIQKVNQNSRHADLCSAADWLGSADFCWVWMEFGGNSIGNKIRVIRQMLPLSVAPNDGFWNCFEIIQKDRTEYGHDNPFNHYVTTIMLKT